MIKAIFVIVSISTFVTISCKKESNPIAPMPSNLYTPTCAYYNQENVGGNWVDRYYFFDLTDTSTSKKMYFKARKLYADRDTLEIIVQPQSIDSIARNFPSELTNDVGFGWVGQWTNNLYRLKILGNNFYKENLSISGHSYLNDPSQMGSLAGKWPQAKIEFQEPNGVGGTLRHTGIFYFKENKCYHGVVPIASAYSVKSISSITPEAGAYDWNNVSSYFHYWNGTYRTHYFLDFKNWRYFTWEEKPVYIGGALQLQLVYNRYKSLDKLLKWPDGWKKR